jgi:hypothetical protein
MILLKLLRDGVGSVLNLTLNAIYILNYYKSGINGLKPTPLHHLYTL